jgi:hypothetical protein
MAPTTMEQDVPGTGAGQSVLVEHEAHRMIEETFSFGQIVCAVRRHVLGGAASASCRLILKKSGENRRSRTLTEAADAISRAYGGQDAPDEPSSLNWPIS